MSRRKKDQPRVRRNLVRRREDQPDPLLGAVWWQRNNIKMGLVDELLQAVESEEGWVGKVDAEGRNVHVPPSLNLSATNATNQVLPTEKKKKKKHT